MEGLATAELYLPGDGEWLGLGEPMGGAICSPSKGPACSLLHSVTGSAETMASPSKPCCVCGLAEGLPVTKVGATKRDAAPFRSGLHLPTAFGPWRTRAACPWDSQAGMDATTTACCPDSQSSSPGTGKEKDGGPARTCSRQGACPMKARSRESEPLHSRGEPAASDVLDAPCHG